jgi:hypothetical protein
VGEGMKCKNCGHDSFLETMVTFKNGTEHMERRCHVCDAHNGYAPQDVTKFRMPYGKHIGMTLQEIWEKDPGYLTWIFENVNNKISKRVGCFLAYVATAPGPASLIS